jgi:hypothetical protein
MMGQAQSELALRASTYLLLVLLGGMLIVMSLVSMCKENHQELPVNGIIWFTLAIVVVCAFLLLAAHRKSLEKVSHHIEAISS